MAHNRYGYHVANTSYFICHSAETIARIFNRLRADAEYPTRCGDFAIKGVRDLTTGFDSNQADNKAVLPTSSSSQMITFTFVDGSVATLRTSGTEPKIKYYTEVRLPPGGDAAAARSHLEKLQQQLVAEFLEPEKNGLISRATD
ncbi:glucose 1,6-bisphosphate synthase-like [Sycon ciliatum]|uniref:glucose 1,6-bisphosphate synthase-like n=1 Tax=Sycon ciliatum TaxID=27933 RepID=UPI0031F66436